MKHGIEYRRVFPLEVRKTGDDGEMLIEGHAAVFNSEVTIGDWFREIIRPGAFTKTLSERDQVMLWNHDSGKPLARKSTGTLTLKEDDTGLASGASLPDSSWGHDAFEAIKRGDVQGMSFGFYVVKERVTQEENELSLREILEASLIEVSPVTFPAYPVTDIQARAVYEAMEASGILVPVTTVEPEQGLHSTAGTERRVRLLRLRGEALNLYRR